MSLSDLAALGSFISGFAVLVSLVFLYFQLKQVGEQVKQSEKNQQASIRLGRATRIVDITLARTEPSLAAAFAKGMSGAQDISELQLSQYGSYCTALFNHAEDSFHQHEEGLLNEVAFQTFVAGWKMVFGTPGMRTQWKRQRTLYVGDFPEFMNRMCDQQSSALSIYPALTDWRVDVAAELA